MEKRKLTKEELEYAMEEGWTREEAEKGYCIVQDFDLAYGAHHIEKIDALETFDTDEEAAKYAEEHDGIKLVHDIPKEAAEELNGVCFLDRADAVKVLKEYFEEKYKIQWRK